LRIVFSSVFDFAALRFPHDGRQADGSDFVRAEYHEKSTPVKRTIYRFGGRISAGYDASAVVPRSGPGRLPRKPPTQKKFCIGEMRAGGRKVRNVEF
jgi:hypothetical protein